MTPEEIADIKRLAADLERKHGDRAIDGLFVQVGGGEMMTIIRTIRADATALTALLARVAVLETFTKDTAEWTGEGGPGTDWQAIVRGIGQSARTALKGECAMTVEQHWLGGIAAEQPSPSDGDHDPDWPTGTGRLHERLANGVDPGCP